MCVPVFTYSPPSEGSADVYRYSATAAVVAVVVVVVVAVVVDSVKYEHAVGTVYRTERKITLKITQPSRTKFRADFRGSGWNVAQTIKQLNNKANAEQCVYGKAAILVLFLPLGLEKIGLEIPPKGYTILSYQALFCVLPVYGMTVVVSGRAAARGLRRPLAQPRPPALPNQIQARRIPSFSSLCASVHTRATITSRLPSELQWVHCCRSSLRGASALRQPTQHIPRAIGSLPVPAEKNRDVDNRRF